MSNWPGVRTSAAPVFFFRDGRNAGDSDNAMLA
jgi:hypothetical protein